MRHKLLILLLVSLAISAGRAADPKDDFSEFDAPEDFDTPAKPAESKQHQQKVETAAKPPKDEVNTFALTINNPNS
jgi:hypothetical protein